MSEHGFLALVVASGIGVAAAYAMKARGFGERTQGMSTGQKIAYALLPPIICERYADGIQGTWISYNVEGS